MAANQERLSAVAHYVIAHCTPEKLGATKLNKVLWYADVIFYRLHGHAITGEEVYEKRQYGPVPKNINAVLRSLQAAGKIKERLSLTPVGSRREFVWLESPAIDKFSAEEIDVLRDVMQQVCDGHSAASISELTHDALWDETEIGQDMSVGAGAVLPGEITPDAIKWAEGAFDEYRAAGNRLPD
jgi:uncharacterized phage-associated protein